ncbi:hypothetical protein ACFIJ5_11150 [Haloimpatiens sp. FM7330]|uniref:hypothetical protein n=1 Tax=Haloimpatiens sp. FM7330 TaxID=3298610 RepID=UPI00362731D4
MEKINFLPQWYKNNKTRKINSIVKNIIVVLLIVSAILFIKSINLRNKLNTLTHRHESIQKQADTNKTTKMVKDTSILMSMEAFLEMEHDYKGEIIFENTILEKNYINLKLKIQHINTYFDFIKKIENDNKYRIVDLTVPCSKTSNEFNITVEVVK